MQHICETLLVLIFFKALTSRSGTEISRGEDFASLRCFGCEVLVQCAVDCKSAGVIEVVLFPKPEVSADLRFMSIGQVKVSLRGDDQLLV